MSTIRAFALAALAVSPGLVLAFPKDRDRFDPDAVRRTIDQYTVAWRTGDSAAVMRLLAPDAVLLPHHGGPPRRGRAEIESFWWPAGLRFRIDAFDQTVDEISGAGDLAYARGRFRLVFAPDTASPRSRRLSQGNWVALFRRSDEGWRISHRLWDDPQPITLDTASASCRNDPELRVLDFWLGEWVVSAGGKRVGTNRIAPTLNGCAITEDWTDATGGQGKSVFYYEPAAAQWRQVWVTGEAKRPGGMKEKRLVARYPGGAVRFEGEIRLPGGGRYLDRTTLYPMPDSSVRQLIEVSENGGGTWRAVFDGDYRRR